MASKKKVQPVQEGEPVAVATPVAVDGAIFVNPDKLGRAKDILLLVSGKRAPANDSEADRKDNFTRHFATHEKDPKDKDALRFIYEDLLGGLVRSTEEQEDADSAARATKSRMKKKQIEETATPRHAE